MASLTLFVGCSSYDDSSLWKGLDEAYNSMTEISSKLDLTNSQISLLSTIVNGGVITSITTNSNGDNVVTYKGADNVEHTAIVATKFDITTAPIVGIKEDAGKLYWTLTVNGKTTWLTGADNQKIPVSGTTPILGLDKDGYWTMDGIKIIGSDGKPIKSEGKSSSVIKAISESTDGYVTLTLADGSNVEAKLFDAFKITIKSPLGETIIDKYAFPEVSGDAVLNYEISGPQSSMTFVKIQKTEGLTAVLDDSAKTITITFPDQFSQGSLTLFVCDDKGDIIVKKIKVVATNTIPEYYGIMSAGDLQNFAIAFNSGKSIARYCDESGTVILLKDIDFSNITSYSPIGTKELPFNGKFDGKGYSIKGINFKSDISSSPYLGIFANIDGAEISNLIVGQLGDKLEVVGTAANGSAIGGIVGNANNSSITSCTNNLSIAFSGIDADKILLCVGGILGAGVNSTVGGDNSSAGCYNNGDITCGSIANVQAGSTAAQFGGIVGFAKSGDQKIIHCTNNGKVNAPSGRSGGIVGTIASGTVSYCINNGFIEDDAIGEYTGATDKYGIKRMGGIAGGSTGSNTIMENCINNGNVFSYLGCRVGGFSGHNEGMIKKCTNMGAILADNQVVGTTYHGAGWACGYNKSAELIEDCTGKGHVGSVKEYKSNPSGAPAACHNNAVCHYKTNYDPEKNYVDMTLDSYYDWEIVMTKSLHSGVTYTQYSFNNLPRKMYILEVDLTDPTIEISTSMADDIVPNPNGNGNANNGKLIRETLSENCSRKRVEGQNILAGFNTGFFDSNDGFPRGIHIEDGNPVYVNNKTVRDNLVNHSNCFTYFKDGTTSCGQKTFTGKILIAGKEFEYYSINDTIVRRGSNTLQANVFTSRYKKIPHSDYPSITNPLSKNAYYLVVKNNNSKLLQVNEGWCEGTIEKIDDGRTSPLSEAPYLTANDEWAIQLTGDVAASISAVASVGAAVSIRADISVDGSSSKPILTQNSSMFQFLKDGVDNTALTASHPQSSTSDPMTFAAIDKTTKKVYFIAVDGRQSWVSLGVTFYEAYRIAKKLGCYNMTRFDGGGSTSMWVYSDGTGALVNKPSDSKGERSCMNYMHIRVKK